MYLSSTAPILTDQRADAARHGAASDARIQNMRETSACGRVRLFNSLIAPSTVADALGMGTAINTQILQNQTAISRATGILGTGGALDSAGVQPSVAQVIAGAPEVVSLNRGGGCVTPSYTPVPLGADPTPGMPHRAPSIVNGPDGPMYYRGADSTISGDYTVAATGAAGGARGLSGIAPPWSDAWIVPPARAGGSSEGFMNWMADNPLWVLALAGAGVYALSRRSGR